MSRALWFVLACGCYAPSPPEGLACSETDHCPSGQTCDLVFQKCAAFPLCGTDGIVDPLTQTTEGCQPWGNQFGHAHVDVTADALVITPLSDGDNDGGCEAAHSIAFEPGGIFIEVPGILTVSRGITGFRAQQGNSPTVIAHDGLLELATDDQTIATLPYDATAMRWWRLRPDRTANTTVGEYSADGSHWKLLGAADTPPEAEITVQFSASIRGVVPDPGTARFRNLDVCPPRP